MSEENKLPLQRAAMIYDFDGTLAEGNLQERTFIPKVGMTKDAFWAEVKARKQREDADEILTYMHLMLETARRAGVEVTKAALRKHGADAPLFPGLAGKVWFERINAFAAQQGIALEHYILSSGIEEMILGCPIADAFEKIFASKFIYEGEHASWPGVAINYTTKTQYVFRINKGIANHWDNDSFNAFTAESERPIPFERMIFLGDGDTDIPTMRTVNDKGGHSVAVYDPGRTDRDMNKIHRLIADRRVDFVAPADYREKSQLEIIVKGILGRIARAATLRT